MRQAIDAANAAQQAHSPARKTMPIGHNFDEGIAVGIEDMRPKVDKAAAQTMISAMDAATRKATLAQLRDAMDLSLIHIYGQVKSWGDNRRGGLPHIRIEGW